jgi:hypothetical protein
MLLGDGYLVPLPEAADLPLAGLKDVEVDLLDAHAVLDGVQHELTRLTSLPF